MSKGYMKQIAEMLGVELGEKFKLVYPANKDRIEGLYAICEGSFWRADTEENQQDRTFAMVLNGSYQIKKFPWKPKVGDTYYIPCIDVGSAYATELHWSDTYNDKQRYRSHMVCKTTDEAVKKAEKMLTAISEVNAKCKNK